MPTATITKQSVTKLTDTDYQVTIHIVIKDDLDVILLEKDYSERYYSALQVSEVKAKLQAQMITDWDKYVAEQAIFNAAQFDTVVSEIQTAANAYINS